MTASARTIALLSFIVVLSSTPGAEPSVPAPPDGNFTTASIRRETGAEDDITLDDIKMYESLAGKPAAWIYFSNNWFSSREFPFKTAEMIRDHGAIPFIRLMLRSSNEQNKREKTLLWKISLPQVRRRSQSMGRARQSVQFATAGGMGHRVQRQVVSWNGSWNGGKKTDGFGDKTKPDGPERFIAAYRHIVESIAARARRILPGSGMPTIAMIDEE